MAKYAALLGLLISLYSFNATGQTCGAPTYNCSYTGTSSSYWQLNTTAPFQGSSGTYGVNAVAYDSAVPGAGGGATQNCRTRISDRTTAGASAGMLPSTSGETNDRHLSAHGYWLILKAPGGPEYLFHGNSNFPSGWDTNCYHIDTPSQMVKFSWAILDISDADNGTTHNIFFLSNSSSCASTTPVGTYLCKVTATYTLSANAISLGTATALYNFTSCPGYPSGLLQTLFLSQFSEDLTGKFITTGWGPGNQGTAGAHNLFVYNASTNSCASVDTYPNGTVSTAFNSGPFSVTNASWASNTATLTIGSNTFSANETVTVTGITSSMGSYNGTFQLTAATATTISFALISNPGTYSSGGTVNPSLADGTTWSCPQDDGEYVTIYTADGVMHTTSIGAFCLHSDYLNKGGNSVSMSGYAYSWNNLCGSPGASNSCGTVWWKPNTTTIVAENSGGVTGHSAPGVNHIAVSNNPVYLKYAISAPNGTRTTIFDFSPDTWEELHSTWPQPDWISSGGTTSDTAPIIGTSATNNAFTSSTTFSVPYQESIVGFSQGGTTQWWFGHTYGWVNSLENFQGVNAISATSLDGNWTMWAEDGLNGVNGNTGYGTCSGVPCVDVIIMHLR